MRIGPYLFKGNLIVAPMAGVSDLPFRNTCRRYGASMAVSEMISANPMLSKTRKTLLRSNHADECEPRSIQIFGACPKQLAEAARLNVGNGAQIIDINMGCPAKKVCNVAAGSALLRDEPLVAKILEAVVKAVEVPVTLKLRTGWHPSNRNAVNIAKIAERSGIQALAVHGRTRSCGFSGQAEYNTIAEVKTAVSIPVIANGDVDSPIKAKMVLEQTNADALMIGRAAWGKPWIFAAIQEFVDFGRVRVVPDVMEIRELMLVHLAEIYAFYGEIAGVRIARKHIGWYVKNLPLIYQKALPAILTTESSGSQIDLLNNMFDLNSGK